MSSKSRFEGLADAAVRCAPANCRRDKAALIAWLRDNENAVLEKLFTKENQRISRRTKILAYCVAAQRTAAKPTSCCMLTVRKGCTRGIFQILPLCIR